MLFSLEKIKWDKTYEIRGICLARLASYIQGGEIKTYGCWCPVCELMTQIDKHLMPRPEVLNEQ